MCDRQTGVITRESVGTGGVQANGDSDQPAVSDDGRFVVFGSLSDNLVPGDTNGQEDMFLRDMQTGTTTRLSVAADGTQGNGPSFQPTVNFDGRYVTFSSRATNLVPGDANGYIDVFVRDLQKSTTSRVSVGPGGAEANNVSLTGPISISGDGRLVAFQSSASNLVAGDTNAVDDVFIHDQGGSTPACAPGNARRPACDFDGDGKADPTVFRPATNTWYQLRSVGSAGYGVIWGAAGDLPL